MRGEIADAGANRGGRTTAHRVGELAGFFLKLGMIAFGGPAAHLAMMDAEVVRKRGWLTREQFLDLLGAANLIPGPSSTEMAIYIGLVRAGWRGLIVAGTCFILPAMVIVLALAVAYVEYGYVLLAFLRADLVQRWGWLSDQQLIDAIAVGQPTPGPVFTTATFIGYVVAGFPGAILATIGIFLPSFLLVAASYPVIPRLRRSSWTAGFLDGVNVASLGLMAVVTWQLGRAALLDGVTFALGLAATLAVFTLRVNSAWLVLGGGMVGLALKMLG